MASLPTAGAAYGLFRAFEFEALTKAGTEVYEIKSGEPSWLGFQIPTAYHFVWTLPERRTHPRAVIGTIFPQTVSLALQRLDYPHGQPLQSSHFEDEFEAQFRKLTSRQATADASKTYFVVRGKVGAQWLVGRMRREFSLDRLDAAADVLSCMGSEAVDSVLKALEKPDEASELHAALLGALCWIPPLAIREAEDRVTKVLQQFLTGADQDIAEAAASAARCLSAMTRKLLLEKAFEVARSSSLREVLADELKRS